MKLLGIEFVPLNLPLKNHLETLSIFLVYLLFPMSIYTGPLLTVYILFFTKYWALVVAYLFWTLTLDMDEVDIGNRKSKWVCSWTVFKYAANYFPIKLTLVPGFELHSQKNYLAGVFPHGVIATGAYIGFQTEALNASKVFRHHALHGATFKWIFYAPLAREIVKLLGMCSATPRAIEKLLSYPDGGKIVGIVVGGAAEILLSRKRDYHIILKNRKGFVKLALRNGSPLIPIFLFGETSVYNQYVFAQGSFIRRFQEFTRVIIGIPAFIIINGRGFFQYTFGLLPRQQPINIVAGKPIEFEKIENPTQEDIDKLHELFIQKLTELFEEYKYHFEENPENVKLVIS